MSFTPVPKRESLKKGDGGTLTVVVLSSDWEKEFFLFIHPILIFVKQRIVKANQQLENAGVPLGLLKQAMLTLF